MPLAAPTPCPMPGCPSLVTTAAPCPTHPPLTAPWARSARPGSTRQWRLRRARVLLDSPLCPACLAEDRVQIAEEVHHLVPKSAGGSDDYANLQALCRAHHAALTTQPRGRSGDVS